VSISALCTIAKKVFFANRERKPLLKNNLRQKPADSRYAGYAYGKARIGACRRQNGSRRRICNTTAIYVPISSLEVERHI
jgi:hypothetical protein